MHAACQSPPTSVQAVKSNIYLGLAQPEELRLQPFSTPPVARFNQVGAFQPAS
jgi:hypothetical protein